jgi:hypothetical protein
MPYTNITNKIAIPASEYVFKNWEYSNQANFIQKEILARGAHLALVPTFFITSALDIIVGVGTGIGAICTLGKDKPILQVSINHLRGGYALVSGPYIHFLLTINPHAKVAGWKTGLLSYEVGEALDNFSWRVSPRLNYALQMISLLVTRVVDGIIGLPLAATSILTGGTFTELNSLADSALRAPGLIIKGLFVCTIGIINPEALQ